MEIKNMKDNSYILIMSDREYVNSFQPHFLDSRLITECKAVKIHDEVKDNIFRKADIVRRDEVLVQLAPDIKDVQDYQSNADEWDKKRIKRFTNDYLENVEDIHNRMMCAKLILDSDDIPQAIIFVYSEDKFTYEPPMYLDLLRKYIKETFALDVYLYKEFENEPEGCELKIDESIRNNLAHLLYRASKSQYNSSMQMGGFLEDRMDYILPQDISEYTVKDLKKICKRFGLPVRQFIPKDKKEGSKLADEYIYNLTESIRPIMNKMIFQKVENLHISKVSIIELWRYAEVLDIFEHECEYLNKNEMYKYILNAKDDILNNVEKEVYNRTKLEAMSDLELMKLAKILKIEGITPFMENGRNLLIKAILKAKDIEEDLDYELPSKEELLKMTNRELFGIYMEKLEGDDKNEVSFKTMTKFPKDLFVNFMIEKYSRIISERILFSVEYDDLKQMDKEGLKNFVKKAVIHKDRRKSVLKEMKNMKRKEMLEYVCTLFNVEKTALFKSDEIPSKEEMKEMSKKELVKLATMYGIGVAEFEGRKEIMSYIKDFKDELHDEEKKKAKETKLNVKNLKKMSRLELKQFCQCYGIKYELDWGRKKFAKKIMKFIEKQVKLKDLEEKKNSNPEFMEVNKRSYDNMSDEDLIKEFNTIVDKYNKKESMDVLKDILGIK